MMISTIADKKLGGKIKIWTVCFWLIVWQLASMKIGQEILLVSPVAVFKCLFQESITVEFWQSIALSLGKISCGFCLGLMTGILLAILSKVSHIIRDLILPLIHIMKSIPVASFIILCLVWISSKNLSIFISFVMVFPIIYTNTFQGIEETNKELLEMAELFQVPIRKQIQSIYVSQVLPYVTSASSIALGFCWKSGIAAEVIGLPKGSIGEKLYEAKIYFNTPQLFTWTIVIVILSIFFEKIILFLLKWISHRLEHM